MKNWKPIKTAPQDGTTVLLRVYHQGRQYENPKDRHKWEATVKAKWIDFNGGGWTWNGMFGTPKFWKPIG